MNKEGGRKRRYPRRPKNSNIEVPRIGDYIEIIIKPYKNNIKVKGIVKRILTKRKYHSRGHKVELRDGTIGRTVRIIKRK
jgi:uncharacterized repeat protein (TIGR03833 family)